MTRIELIMFLRRHIKTFVEKRKLVGSEGARLLEDFMNYIEGIL